MFYILVTYRTYLTLMSTTRCYLLYSVVLLLIYPFGHFTHLLFQLQQLLISHIVGIDVLSALIVHPHHHSSHIAQTNQSILFILITSEYTLVDLL